MPFFAENGQKSQKIVIITSTPVGVFFRPFEPGSLEFESDFALARHKMAFW
jgi:hypothetical protein